MNPRVWFQLVGFDGATEWSSRESTSRLGNVPDGWPLTDRLVDGASARAMPG